MSTDMVMFAKGVPESKSREMDGQMPFEEWIYGKPPEEVDFVRINGNRVIRVEIAKNGEPPVVFTKDVVSGMLRTDGSPLDDSRGPHPHLESRRRATRSRQGSSGPAAKPAHARRSNSGRRRSLRKVSTGQKKSASCAPPGHPTRSPEYQPDYNPDGVPDSTLQRLSPRARGNSKPLFRPRREPANPTDPRPQSCKLEPASPALPANSIALRSSYRPRR